QLPVTPPAHAAHPGEGARLGVLAEEVDLVPHPFERLREARVVDVAAGPVQQVTMEHEDSNRVRLDECWSPVGYRVGADEPTPGVQAARPRLGPRGARGDRAGDRVHGPRDRRGAAPDHPDASAGAFAFVAFADSR